MFDDVRSDYVIQGVGDNRLGLGVANVVGMWHESVPEFPGFVDAKRSVSGSWLMKLPELHADSFRFIRWGRNESFSFRLVMELCLRAIESAIASILGLLFE